MSPRVYGVVGMCLGFKRDDRIVIDPQKSSLNRILLGIHVVYDYTSCMTTRRV
ncbi:hypothetical protein LINPERHAP1_LOCUS19711 [Linum perenne]